MPPPLPLSEGVLRRGRRCCFPSGLFLTVAMVDVEPTGAGGLMLRISTMVMRQKTSSVWSRLFDIDQLREVEHDEQLAFSIGNSRHESMTLVGPHIGSRLYL